MHLMSQLMCRLIRRLLELWCIRSSWRQQQLLLKPPQPQQQQQQLMTQDWQLVLLMGVHRRLLQAQQLQLHELLMQQKQQLEQH